MSYRKPIFALLCVIALSALCQATMAQNLLVEPSWESTWRWLGSSNNVSAGNTIRDEGINPDWGPPAVDLCWEVTALQGGVGIMHGTWWGTTPMYEAIHEGVLSKILWPWGTGLDRFVLHQSVDVNEAGLYGVSGWLKCTPYFAGDWAGNELNAHELWMTVTNLNDMSQFTKTTAFDKVEGQWVNLADTVYVGDYPARIDVGWYVSSAMVGGSSHSGYWNWDGSVHSVEIWADDFELYLIPEPGSLLALAGGLIGLAGLRFRRTR